MTSMQCRSQSHHSHITKVPDDLLEDILLQELEFRDLCSLIQCSKRFKELAVGLHVHPHPSLWGFRNLANMQLRMAWQSN